MLDTYYINRFKSISKKLIGGLITPCLHIHGLSNRFLTVFNFHDVIDNPSEFQKEYGLFVSRKVFETQISWIRKRMVIIHPADIVKNEKLPKNAALITFDDGFSGAFDNGINYLVGENIPSIMFLNMETIIHQKPMFSAIASYLGKHVEGFNEYAVAENIKKPYHLTINPDVYSNIEKKYKNLDMHRIWEYQGDLASMNTLSEYNNSPLVTYGNHLYDHWNAMALNQFQFEDQYKKNENELLKFGNYINYFAFTNGRPYTCFASKHVKFLEKSGVKKIFSTYAGVNHIIDSNLYGRLSLVNRDNTDLLMNYRFIQSIFRDRFNNLNRLIVQ